MKDPFVSAVQSRVSSQPKRTLTLKQSEYGIPAKIGAEACFLVYGKVDAAFSDGTIHLSISKVEREQGKGADNGEEKVPKKAEVLNVQTQESHYI